jgi:LPXTG-site transpeptidase (sortase) family protein
MPKKQKKPSIGWRLVPLIVAAAILCIPIFRAEWNRHEARLAAAQAQARLAAYQAAHPLIQGQPSRIVVPSLSIDLPIIRGYYNTTNKQWTVSDTEANWAPNTAEPNNKNGQTLIYGHNSWSIFAGLVNGLKPGDDVYVYTANNHVFQYSYTSSITVSPHNAQALFDSMKSSTGLKLMTCELTDFSWRHVMSLQLVRAT